ncbi:hypothetical protein V5799_020438 [Amblyomma americanum]|uniref:C2H2-type domain-containing protein n=1 Tax=Amblyomma americanum TaxID=6943 RepID=A0AAQ4EU50_AMBAM
MCTLQLARTEKALYAEDTAELGKAENSMTLLLPVYSCKTCDEMFSSPGLLNAHQQHKHPLESLALHRCNYCPFSCDNATAVARHERTHTGEQLSVCQVCGKGFKQPWILKQHLHTHSTMRQHECTECGKRFRYQTSLRHHYRQHAGDDAAEHVCSDCGKKFYAEANLDRHMRTHTRGNRPHVCSQCGQRFAELWHVRCHERIVHSRQDSPEESTRGFMKIVEVKKEPPTD